MDPGLGNEIHHDGGILFAVSSVVVACMPYHLWSRLQDIPGIPSEFDSPLLKRTPFFSAVYHGANFFLRYLHERAAAVAHLLFTHITTSREKKKARENTSKPQKKKEKKE
jgi:hypothetical protein